MTYITQTTCAICGSCETLETRYAAAPSFEAELAPGFAVHAAALVTYERCAGCNSWSQNPRLDDESLGRYYGEGIYRATLGISNDRLDADEMARAKTDAAYIAHHIGKVASHLDIGCSRGYLLQQVGAPIKFGVEPNANWPMPTIDTVRTIDEVGGRYDLVTMIHVLEHEPYPVEFLRKAAEKMNPGGKMIVEVPSWRSKGGPLRLAHLWHWEADSIADTMLRAGLSVMTIINTPHIFVIAKAAI